jgi:uncharacterized protein (TIGR02996 family)
MTAPTFPHDAFLAAVLGAPDDDTPRLVYADWLMEQGDPRGEFIHVQCRLARLSPDDPRRPGLELRERQLLQEHRCMWERPLDGFGSRLVFRRGFVEGMTLDAEIFLRRGEELFRRAPLRRVWLWLASNLLGAVTATPLLLRLVDLDLSGDILTEAEVRDLAHSPYLANLTRLALIGTDLTSEGVGALSRSLALRNLCTLDLHMNRIDCGGARALADSPHLGQLTALNLFRNRIQDAGAVALAESVWLRSLRRLSLRDNPVGPRGREALRRRFGEGVQV